VANLAGAVAHPMQQTAAYDHAATNARADGDVHQVVEAAAGAEAPFAQRCYVAVVVEHHGQPQALAQRGHQRHLIPARQVGRRAVDHPADGI